MKKSILIYVGIAFLAALIKSYIISGNKGLPYILGVMVAYCLIPAIIPLLIYGISKLINKPVHRDTLFYILYAVFFLIVVVPIFGSI